MKTRSISIVMVVYLLVAAFPVMGQQGDDDSGSSSTESAQPDESFSLQRFVVDSQIHKYAGMTSLALATTTAVLGPLDVQAHPYLGAATLASSVISSGLGSIGYSNRLGRVWPHVLLNAVATTGFALNTFVWASGSTEHIATGVLSVASMWAGVIYIVVATGGF